MSAMLASTSSGFEEASLPYTWPSFQNCQKFYMDIYALVGVFTLKIDGSNLSIQIEKIPQPPPSSSSLLSTSSSTSSPPLATTSSASSASFSRDGDGGVKGDVGAGDQWAVTKIIGRASYLYDGPPVAIASLPKLAKYGNASDVNGLVKAMFEYSVQLAVTLKCTTRLTVSGEAFKHGNQAYPSWHPFGFRIADGNIQMLDYPHYQLLSSLSLSMSPSTIEVSKLQKDFGSDFRTSYKEMLSFLETSDKFNVFPPLLLFHGTVSDAVNAIYPMMMENDDPYFEGLFFVVVEKSSGYKWKSKRHEEQKKIPGMELVASCPEHVRAEYAKLKEVFDTKHLLKEIVVVDKKALDDRLKDELIISTNKVISKMAFDPAKPAKERVAFIESILPEVCTEMVSHYSEAGEELPWTAEVIAAKAKGVVTYVVMKLK